MKKFLYRFKPSTDTMDFIGTIFTGSFTIFAVFVLLALGSVKTQNVGNGHYIGAGKSTLQELKYREYDCDNHPAAFFVSKEEEEQGSPYEMPQCKEKLSWNRPVLFYKVEYIMYDCGTYYMAMAINEGGQDDIQKNLDGRSECKKIK